MSEGRTDGDSWGPASSVGATATMVAASRAVASQGPDALLDDPFADPLVRAVGLDPFIRIIDGEIDFEDDALFNRKTRREQITVRTRFFDDFFTGATADGVRQAVILARAADAVLPHWLILADRGGVGRCLADRHDPRVGTDPTSP